MYHKEIKRDRPELSDQQIDQHKNFKAVLQQSQASFWFKNKWLWTGAGIATITAILYFGWPFQGNRNSSLLSEEVVATQEDDTLSKKMERFWVSIEGDTLYAQYNVAIIIPEKAFVKEGVPYQGKTEIKFKSYFDYAAILHHNMDMQYDTAGYNMRLETAGMFEIYAFDEKGNALEVADHKKITVQMPTPNTEDHNFYFYDKIAQEWQYMGKANNIIVRNEKGETNKMDIDALALRNLEQQKSTCSRKIVDLQQQTPIKPIRKEETNFVFELDIDISDFPALKSFDGLKMAFHPGEPVSKKTILKKAWSSMELRQIEEGVLYELEVKDGSQTESVKVVPVGKSEIWDKKMKAYQQWSSDLKEEKQKLEEIEERIQAQRAEIIAADQQKEAKRLEQLNPRIDEQEVQDLSSWVSIRVALDEYARKGPQLGIDSSVHPSKHPDYQAYSRLMRQYDVPRTGLFNCDRPIKYPDNKKVQAVFASADQDVKFLQVILIDKTKNTTFPYEFPDFKSFGFNPRHKNIIFAFDKKGSAYFYSPEKFDAVNNSMDHFLFNLQPCVKDISSEEKLRLFLSEQWALASS